MATEQQVKDLVDAAWQCLDDMGAEGKSVCPLAKVLLRLAVEPFLPEDDKQSIMPIAEAERLGREWQIT